MLPVSFPEIIKKCWISRECRHSTIYMARTYRCDFPEFFIQIFSPNGPFLPGRFALAGIVP
jgi:hypothetical protein